MNSMDNFKSRISKLDKAQIACFVILAIIVLYISFGVNNLPTIISRLFLNKYFNFVMFSIVAIISCKCPCIGIMLAIALLMTIASAEFPLMPVENMENIQEYQQVHSAEQVPTTEAKPGCPRVSEYRNEFYPQYVNSDYYAYDSKDADQQSVTGFDISSRFDYDNADDGSRSGVTDGTRSTYDSNRATYN